MRDSEKGEVDVEWIFMACDERWSGYFRVSLCSIQVWEIFFEGDEEFLF